MATWLRTHLASATETVGRRVGLEDYSSLFESDPEAGYAVRSVALLRCERAPATTGRASCVVAPADTRSERRWRR